MTNPVDQQASYGQYSPANGTNGRARVEPAEAAPVVRIPFGDRPTQNMPADWAEVILRALIIHHPAIFRQLLFFAATGDDIRTYVPEVTRRKRSNRDAETGE